MFVDSTDGRCYSWHESNVVKKYTVSCLSMGWNQIIIDVKHLIHYAYKHFFVLTCLWTNFTGSL